MTLEQLINQKVQQLPSTLQQEVLDFVEFLETKQTIKPQSEQIQPIQENMGAIQSKNELALSQSESEIEQK